MYECTAYKIVYICNLQFVDSVATAIIFKGGRAAYFERRLVIRAATRCRSAQPWESTHSRVAKRGRRAEGLFVTLYCPLKYVQFYPFFNLQL